MKRRIIDIKGQPQLVILSYKDYLELLEAQGKPKPQIEIKKIQASKGQKAPEEVLRRLQKGESPVKAWRLYRDMTQTELANRSGVSASAISLIENSVRPGTIETFKALAKALNIKVNDLIDPYEQKRQKIYGRKAWK